MQVFVILVSSWNLPKIRNSLSRGVGSLARCVAAGLLLAAILAVPAKIVGQQVISVRVTDQTGASVRGAAVMLLSGRRGTTTSATSNAEGRADIPCYAGAEIEVRALGFEAKTTVIGDCGHEIAFKLSPAAVQTTINVTVTPDTVPNEATMSSSRISRTTARTVIDALEDLSPAIYVTRRGVMGYGISTNGTGQMNIRGVGGSPNTNVLMVYGGRPDFQGEMGHPLPDFYSLSNAGSIRVIEGPASVLYGSNAMGGVVEVEPREPEEGAEFELTSSLGSFMTGQHRLFAGIRRGRGLYTFSSGINHTDGDRSYSAYRSQDGSLGASYTISSVWMAKIDGNYGHFYVEDPGKIGTGTAGQNYAAVGRGGFSVDLANSTQVLTGYTRFYTTWGRNFISDGFRSTDRMTGGRVYQTWTALRGVAIDFGADLANYGGVARQYGGTNYGGEHQLNDNAGFVRAHWAPTVKTVINAGVRYQANSQFGDIAVPEFGVLWHASSRVMLSGAIGRGFRNPTIRELYLFPAPNPDLRPETEWNYQATTQARITRTLAAWTTFYYAKMNNQIVTQGYWPNMQMLNGGKAINKGVETSLRWAMHRQLSASAGYAYLRSTNLAALIPENKANLALDADLKKVFLHVGIQAVGRRYQTILHTAQLGGYTEASMKLSVPMSRNLSFFGAVENLFNHRYQVVTGYPMPCVNGAGGFVLHF
jgi:outer membrane cobalamin receptor